jgi:transcriptional regulator with XRE-family HTH domain
MERKVEQMNAVGDLGRRVMERRHQLGLTVDDVAGRAGMCPDYLRFVESSPAPQLSPAALWRLASSLNTSVDTIAGSGMEDPPGRGSPSDPPALESLSVEECQRLIAPGGVGRLVFSDARGPVALPVNFRILKGDIVFRTDSEATFLAEPTKQSVSFEVDHLDDALTEGWSVLLTGDSRLIDDPGEIEQARALGIAPWAGGVREGYVCLTPRQVTGRRIRRRSDDG